MSELPHLEVMCYFLIWTCGVSVSLYHLYLVGKVFDHRHHDQYHYEDFSKGWELLGNRYQDQSDYEWNTWTALFIKLSPFLFINFVVAECLRWWKCSHALPLWYTTVAVSFLLLHFNILLTLWFLGQTLTYFLIIHCKTHAFVWILSFIIIHYLKPDSWFVESDEDQYLVMVSSSWIVLRCISYSTETLNNSIHSTQNSGLGNVLRFLGYSLYLPTMFCGPFISFCHFEKGINCKNSHWTSSRVVKIVKNFAKCTFWYLFTIISLHYIYVNAILLRPHFVGHLLDWELAGLGIAMGHFFHLKYFVFYGIPCAWASAEGYTTPKLPCCVSRVHLYSYMWRHFDEGLYQFLVRYIYVPIISRMTLGSIVVKKLLASVACFAFMFTWHREQKYVFFWVLFNYVAIAIELTAKQTFALPKIRAFVERNLSPQNQLRIQCLAAAPLHCFSMISNYFFIGNGMDIGLVYLQRVFYGSYSTKLTIWFFLYGAGQSAVAMQKWRLKKQERNDKHKRR